MPSQKMGLIARSIEFKAVIENSICTDANGKTLDLESSLQKIVEQFIFNRDQGGAVYLVGNGGSAGIASHAITDFLNVCHMRAFTLHESSLITCMANDFGYENAYARILNTVFRPQDILIAISSSGKSMNIRNAAKVAAELGGIVITLSGFNKDNPLRTLGDLNLWLDSSDYGLVEIGHAFLLHNLADRIGFAKKMQSSEIEKVIENL